MYCKYSYESKDYGKIRVIVDAETEEVLYCARDVAKAFGYREPGKVANDRCLNVVKEKHRTPSGMQILNFINKAEIDKLVVSDFSIDKMYYLHCLAEVRNMAVTKAREKAEKIIVDEISTMVRMFNKTSDRINDAILIMPNSRTYHIEDDGSVHDISKAVGT